jgi:hypothetical protein
MAQSERNGTRQKSLAKRRKGSGESQKIVTIFQELEIPERMPPLPESKLWTAGDDETIAYEWPDETKSSLLQKETTLRTQFRQLSKRLFRARSRGNVRPKLGQMCLVMIGESGCDEGQMGIVSERTPCMVRVTYICNQLGKEKTKLKRPSSLIMLDPNVTLVQEDDGSLWIRPCA